MGQKYVERKQSAKCVELSLFTMKHDQWNFTNVIVFVGNQETLGELLSETRALYMSPKLVKMKMWLRNID